VAFESGAVHAMHRRLGGPKTHPVSSLPSQNRACGFPAHGSPPSSRRAAFRPATGVGRAPQQPSLRDVGVRVSSLSAIPLPHRWAAHSAGGPSLQRVLLSAPSPLLWPPPTPAPLSPVSRLLTVYRVRRSQSTVELAPRRSSASGGLGRRRVSPVPTSALPPFRALYAAGFFGAAPPSTSPLPWPSPTSSRLGSPLSRLSAGPPLDAAGFASCCGPVVCIRPRADSTPRFSAQVSPNAGGLLRRCLGTSFDRTSTGKSS